MHRNAIILTLSMTTIINAENSSPLQEIQMGVYTRLYLLISHLVITTFIHLFSDITPLNLKDDNCFSAGAAAGITAVTCLLVTVSVFVGIGGCVWCKVKRGQGSIVEVPQQKIKQMQEAIYDELLGPGIVVRDNQAYDHSNVNRENN